MLNPNTQWLRDARWGLMFHYLDKPASSNVESPTSSEDWNRRVDAFDVAGFARQVKNSGAGYVIFTLGQNTGHFCAPNALYDDLVGVKPSLLSRRDLIAELAEALAPDVRLIAYLPSNAPANHREAVRALRFQPSWDGSAWGLKRFWADNENADEKLSEFQNHWEAIAAHWGQKWGDRVQGWWIDGCYFADRMYRDAEGPNFSTFAHALRAGNPNRILAFNSGTATPFERLTTEQDYTAGEFSNKFPAHDTWNKLEGELNGMQTQLLSFLGEYWGRGEPRFPTSLVSAYTDYVNQRGVAMTWDVPFSVNGIIPDAFLRQLDGILKR